MAEGGLNLADLSLILIIGLVAIAFLIWIALYIRKKRNAQIAHRKKTRDALLHGPSAAPGSSAVSGLDPYFTVALRSVAERYSLASITVATTDGLAVASTRSDPHEEAALYKTITSSGIERSSTAQVFPIDYYGIPLIGIVHPDRDPSPEWRANVEDDVKIILSLWI
ncbi:MAG: hypothetical protein LUQ25_08580 [Methanoregulaceae archaeon]|nr:hypothetical protein [Methanoregulaceae archaeon]